MSDRFVTVPVEPTPEWVSKFEPNPHYQKVAEKTIRDVITSAPASTAQAQAPAPVAVDEREAFVKAWPEIHKHGIDEGWYGIALAAWKARAALSTSVRPVSQEEQKYTQEDMERFAKHCMDAREERLRAATKGARSQEDARKEVLDTAEVLPNGKAVTNVYEAYREGLAEAAKVCDQIEGGKYPGGETASGLAWECALAIRSIQAQGEAK